MKFTHWQGGCLPLSQGYIHVYDHPFHRFFSLKLLGESKANFFVELPWEGGKKVYINGPGHLTKMAAMLIYGKNRHKISPTELNVL